MTNAAEWTASRELAMSLMGKRVAARWWDTGPSIRVDEHGQQAYAEVSVEIRGEVCGWYMEGGKATVTIAGYGDVELKHVRKVPEGFWWKVALYLGLAEE